MAESSQDAAVGARLPGWHLCPTDAARRAVVDGLCAKGWTGGQRVAVLRSPETVLGNLCSLENILLAGSWHGSAQALRAEVSGWLEQEIGADAVAAFLLRRGDQLSARERDRVAIARTVQLGATQVLIDEEIPAADEWLAERLALLGRLLPAAEVVVVSTRHPPATLPWRIHRGDPAGAP